MIKNSEAYFVHRETELLCVLRVVIPGHKASWPLPFGVKGGEVRVRPGEAVAIGRKIGRLCFHSLGRKLSYKEPTNILYLTWTAGNNEFLRLGKSESRHFFSGTI